LSYGDSADVILVSVAQDEKEDFENTRLSKILSNFESSKLYFVDWQNPDSKTNTVSLDQLIYTLSNAIDTKITTEREKICLMCSSVND
jgi:hypothetical protein